MSTKPGRFHTGLSEVSLVILSVSNNPVKLWLSSFYFHSEYVSLGQPTQCNNFVYSYIQFGYEFFWQSAPSSSGFNLNGGWILFLDQEHDLNSVYKRLAGETRWGRERISLFMFSPAFLRSYHHSELNRSPWKLAEHFCIVVHPHP